MAIFADAPPARGAAGRPASGLLAVLIARGARWREYRRTREELESLDDRSLADIGLYRCDIPRVAREAAGY